MNIEAPTISRSEAERGRYFDARPPIVRQALEDRSPVLLLSGPMGTGKTRLALEKVRACCLRYPRSRWLMLRSVRKWLTQSALVTWEEKVIVPGELLPDRIHRNNRTEYRFRNGSVVVVAGLDDPQQVMSAEYDGAFIVEATEVSLDTAEKVGGRLRNARMPYQPLLMDCNPGPPTHWLKQGAEANRLRMIPSRHTDNPHLYNQTTQQWTPAGTAYMTRLDAMTGTRRLRLRDGLWASAEGVVYDQWDATKHVVDETDWPIIPASWPRYWVIDFGFTNPLVWQWWAEDSDGRLWMYREIYKTGLLVKDAAEWAGREAYGEPRPRAVVTDHDPEAMQQVELYAKVQCTLADKAVASGIQDVANRLTIAGDGKPRLFIKRNALCHQPDAPLVEQAKPTHTAAEVDGYIWDPTGKKGERPLKKDDHGVDCWRYLCRHLAENLGGPKEYGSPKPSHQPLAGLPAGTFG